jgi:HD-GYP domain-containing protein (c-di-GMP phosphodiesterase class II)
LKVQSKRPKLNHVKSLFGDNQEQNDKLLNISAQTDAFEGYSSPHGRRIASVADALAEHFNLASRDRFFLQQAGLLHDIGELAMNREYIGASRELTSNERLDMQRHPVLGEQEAAKLELPRGVQLLIRWHHEWWNGSGYPDGLVAEQIPLAARILRIADTYSSMTASRPYRRSIAAEEVRSYLIEWAGIEFDPAVVKAFLIVAGRSAQRTEAAPTVLEASTS